MRILVTGAAGFIGSNFVQHLLRQDRDCRIVALDKLTYAGNLRNLDLVSHDPRFTFVHMDICDRAVSDVLSGCDAVVNFAAESHVDRSIEDPTAFVRTNVDGTLQLLEACRRLKIGRFLQISTDEVYGSLGPHGKFSETTPLAPNSPYAATKASADMLVRAYVHTYGLPALITRSSNNYGPYQFPEKFIPLMIVLALRGNPLPVYGDGKHVRDWIHVEDHCRAIDGVLQYGQDGEIYNIGGDCEMENLEVINLILELLGHPRSSIRHIADRPGHDRRYAMNCEKIKERLGWKQLQEFPAGIADTIRWYRNNRDWLNGIESGTYRDYMMRHYDHREVTLNRLKATSNF